MNQVGQVGGIIHLKSDTLLPADPLKLPVRAPWTLARSPAVFRIASICTRTQPQTHAQPTLSDCQVTCHRVQGFCSYCTQPWHIKKWQKLPPSAHQQAQAACKAPSTNLVPFANLPPPPICQSLTVECTSAATNALSLAMKPCRVLSCRLNFSPSRLNRPMVAVPALLMSLMVSLIFLATYPLYRSVVGGGRGVRGGGGAARGWEGCQQETSNTVAVTHNYPLLVAASHDRPRVQMLSLTRYAQDSRVWQGNLVKLFEGAYRWSQPPAGAHQQRAQRHCHGCGQQRRGCGPGHHWGLAGAVNRHTAAGQHGHFLVSNLARGLSVLVLSHCHL